MVLVTGSSGMLGRVLCGVFEKKHPVLGVSKSGTNGVACDLSDPEALRGLFGARPIKLAVHAAAYSDVDGCEQDPKRAYAANALAPKNLSALCAAKNVPWIHVSTDYVFDGRKREPYVESDAAGPVNIYGLTKWIGEFYAQRSVPPCAIVRTSWLFGPGNPNNFVNAIASRLEKESTVSVLDDQADAPTSVKDLSLAIARIADVLLERGASKRWNETFHVCNSGGTTRYEMTNVIRDALGRKNVRVEKADRSQIKNRVAIRPQYAVMSPARFEKTFGMKMRPWRESLREYIEEKVSCVS